MIGPRREWRKGWAVQSVNLSAGVISPNDWRRKGKERAIVRRYVKLWRKVEGEWNVVDRALTQKNAMARARQILQQEAG